MSQLLIFVFALFLIHLLAYIFFFRFERVQNAEDWLPILELHIEFDSVLTIYGSSFNKRRHRTLGKMSITTLCSKIV